MLQNAKIAVKVHMAVLQMCIVNYINVTEISANYGLQNACSVF